MIVLTFDDANRVRGRSPKDGSCALDPVPLRDGRYMLGEECLTDPAHDDVREFLTSLPRVPLGSLPRFTAGYPPPDQETSVADLTIRGE